MGICGVGAFCVNCEFCGFFLGDAAASGGSSGNLDGGNFVNCVLVGGGDAVLATRFFGLSVANFFVIIFSSCFIGSSWVQFTGRSSPFAPMPNAPPPLIPLFGTKFLARADWFL